MYVIGTRGYMPVRDQQLGASNSMQSTFSEEEKSIERVHQWIAQQHKFSGIPPPEEEPSALFRSQSTADITAKDVSSITDSTTFTDWLPIYTSEDEMLKFSGLEVNRYYSPNMTRRRGYIPRSDPSLNTTQLVVNSNRTNLTQLPTRQHNGDIRGSPVAFSSRGSPVTCSPLSRYFYRSGEGNTFPRRNKLSNKDDHRNLFTSSIMDHHQEKIRSSSSDERLQRLPRQYNERFISNQYEERVIPNHYNTGQQSNSESIEHVLEDEAIFLTENRSFVSNGVKLGVTQEQSNMAAENNSSLIGSMSLDTQRLLSGNLPDVALTAAKAIHKRELSDSLPKYKGAIKCLFSHVRMSSAPETTYISNEDKNDYNMKCAPCDVRKVKAFSWPKRATLPSYKDFIKGELTKSNTPLKTESGYNTEKSEEKNDLVTVDKDDFNETHSLCEESVHSDHSDLPPARPPLPSQKAYCETKLSSHDLPLSSHDVPLSSDDVPLSSHGVHLKRSVAADHLSSIGGSTAGKTTDTCHQYTSIKYLRGKEHAADCTVSAFCSSTTDLTRNVSMSLKDLIRIHEQEIARVSGGGSTRLKSTDSMHEKYRKCSVTESKGRSKSVWKRHTTIGLLTHFNGVDTEKDILDYRTTDKLPLSIYPDNEVQISSEKSSVVYCEPIQTDNTSPPYSPNASSVKYGRKRNGPLTLPKPVRSSLNSLILDTPGRHNKTADIVKPIISKSPLSPSLSPLYKDACIQTDLVLLDLHENEVAETALLVNVKKELETKFEKEKQIMHRKLEEQKKVANAYQKLEDRYRRKVYELQKALHMCTCSRGKIPVKLDTSHFADSSYSKCAAISQDNHDISVQKVDGILHQLEAWLNNQTNGIHTDTSDFSSLIGSNEDTYPRYRLTPEHYTSPPLEIIDQIDATSV